MEKLSPIYGLKGHHFIYFPIVKPLGKTKSNPMDCLNRRIF